MKSTFVLCQTEQEGKPSVNLKRAEQWVQKAVQEYHPDVVVFPEVYQSHYPLSTDPLTVQSAAEPLHGPFVTGMQNLAKEHGTWLIFGMRELAEEKRHYNTIVILDDNGRLVDTYRKVHLYDAFSFRESDFVQAGDAYFKPISTPFGTLGVFVCYELRYPEVARTLTQGGADLLVMPTAWVKGPKKEEQFRVLTRARAIENAAYVLACDQCGPDTLGCSLAVDPTGKVLAEAGATEAMLMVSVDTDLVEQTRKQCPSYKGVQ